MVAARLRGHDEVGVGSVLGSNIFTTLLIVAVAALISPIESARGEIEVGIAVTIFVVILTIPGRAGRLNRCQSVPSLATSLAKIVS